jgi:multiple sugar transport system permease protein
VLLNQDGTMKRSVKDLFIDLIFPYSFMIFYALLILVPIFFVFISSFKPNQEIFINSLALPKNWNLLNYQKLIDPIFKFDFGKAALNSFLITLGTEALTLVLAFPAAYAIARINTKLSPIIESIFGFGFLIPVFAVMLPIFLLMSDINLLYTKSSLILFYPAIRLPISVLILASFLRQIPIDLENCAMIDGANRAQMMFHIFVPLSIPGIVTVAVLNFIAVWNEFVFAMILLNTKNRTIQLALSTLKSQHDIDYGLIAAGVILSTLPIVIVFMFFQEKIVNGMLAGSMKE